MQKELLREGFAEIEVTSADKAFKKNKDVTAYIENFVKSKKDTMQSLNLHLPEGGTIKITGYGNATLIKASECISYVCGKNAEFAFLWNSAREVCRQHGSEFFNESLLLNIVKDNSKLKKLPESKFREIIITFSALNNANINLLPPQHAFVRMDNDTLKAFSKDCEEQIRCAALLTKLEKENLPPKEAVRKVLEVSNTENFVKACENFGFKVERDLSLSILEKERMGKQKLISFLTKLEETSLSKNEVEQTAREIGIEVCELNLRRRIIKYAREIVEDERSIASKREYIKSLSETIIKEQMEKDLSMDIAYAEKKVNALRNMEEALKVIRGMSVVDESHKP